MLIDKFIVGCTEDCEIHHISDWADDDLTLGQWCMDRISCKSNCILFDTNSKRMDIFNRLMRVTVC